MSGGPQHGTPGDSGRFPGFDVLDRAGSWDSVTTRVVLARLSPPAELRFFNPTEAAAARAVLDRLLAQDAEPKVPLLERLDARLADRQFDGWRYHDMPDDDVAWRLTMAAVDADAAAVRQGAVFASLERPDQIRLLEGVRAGDRWHDLPASRVWNLWMRYACAAFYSHPWAWSEIGFGGPAYPTGYKNLGVDGREAWEVIEQDAFDPEPWARRVERARRRHEGRGEEE